MRKQTWLAWMALASASTLIVASMAGAQPGATQVPDWTLLGERIVDGRVDHDAIVVTAARGRFVAIMVRVDASAIELFNLVVTFGDGQVFRPPTRLVFGAGTNSRSIDLPGGARIIRRIDFSYGNLPGGGRATIRIFGR